MTIEKTQTDAVADQADAITWLISSDSHIVEPPDLWQNRMPAAFRDRAPRVVTEAGESWWYVEGLGRQAVDVSTTDCSL